jgi:hypothetical protein
MYRVFGEEFLNAAELTIQSPRSRGNITLNPENLDYEYDRSPNGPLKLYCALDHENKPPRRKYVVAADISAGLGGSHTSNSAAVVLDQMTGEQVAEIATNTMPPPEFADLCICLAKIFHEAYLSWECNGGFGKAFTKQVLERQYPNIYWRTSLWTRSKNKTKEAGWRTTNDSKGTMFAAVISSVKSGKLTIRSDALLAECRQYIYKKGKIEHAGAAGTDDDSAMGEAHGDRVIAFCVACMTDKDRPVAPQEPEQNTSDPPPDTLAYRDQMHKKMQEDALDPWDDTTNEQLASGRRY